MNRIQIAEMLMGEEQVDVPAFTFAEIQGTSNEVEEEEPESHVVREEGSMVAGEIEVDNEVRDEENIADPGDTDQVTEIRGTDSSDEADIVDTAEVDVAEYDEWNLAIPWTTQAPFANWDETHEDTCEEASVYMAYLYFEGYPEGLVDPTTADEALLEMVREQNEYFGFFKDTTAAQTADFVKQFYNLDYDLIYNPSVEDMKEAIVQGYPVVAPMAGQILANPYFTPPGPDYHMLIVKGFTSEGFITNDPGTRHGENWLYKYDHFMDSIHDYNAGNVETGQKVIIVFKPL